MDRLSPAPPTRPRSHHPCALGIVLVELLIQQFTTASIAGRTIANSSRRRIANSECLVITHWYPWPTRAAPCRPCALHTQMKSSSRIAPRANFPFAWYAWPKRTPMACSSTVTARRTVPSTRWSASSKPGVWPTRICKRFTSLCRDWPIPMELRSLPCRYLGVLECCPAGKHCAECTIVLVTGHLARCCRTKSYGRNCYQYGV